jgi:hypothetical protein
MDWSQHVVGYSYRGMYMSTKFKILEYLTTTKIGEKGQLTVPKRFRRIWALEQVRHLRFCDWGMAWCCSQRNSGSSNSVSKLVRFLPALA